MTREERLEKLKSFVTIEETIKAKQQMLMDESQKFDKDFNDWVQTELGIKDTQKKYHLAEILKGFLE